MLFPKGCKVLHYAVIVILNLVDLSINHIYYPLKKVTTMLKENNVASKVQSTFNIINVKVSPIVNYVIKI